MRIDFIFLTALLLIGAGQAINLKSNGGYELVVTVTGGAGEFTQGVLENIKSNLVSLSRRMWIATGETFFIESAKILVPPGFEPVTAFSEEFEEGDIRISPEVTYPNVDNPNLCGREGNFIQLPLSFFDFANSGVYGDNAKALLVQWARYRWGAWEEHGYPGDAKFPFFYKANIGGTQEWRATGCNNALNHEMVGGEYKTLNGTACDPKGTADLDPNCRYYPDPLANQDMTSSLMHFHFLDSVTKFCDETNHQSETPNRQNFFCDGKSVTETIKSSADFLKVTEPVTALPVVKFQVQKSLQTTNRPALYILLDHGSIDAASAAPLINLVLPQLPRLFDEISAKNVIASVGTFPTNEDDANVTEVVSWQPIAGNENEFIDAIGTFPVGSVDNRDFLLAIEQARESIEKISPVNGGVIVLLKTGPGIDFSKAPYEAIYANSLVEKNIRLFAIEIPTPDETHSKLANVAQYTGGAAVHYGSQDEAENLKNLIADALTSFQDDGVQTLAKNANLQRISYSEEVKSDVEVKIPVSAGAEWVNLYFYTPEDLEVTAISAQIDPARVFQLNKTTEWGQADAVDVGKRYVISGLLNVTGISDGQNVTFKHASPAKKAGYLVIAVEGSELAENYKIEISTTAQDGILDFDGKVDDTTPFIVTAKVFYMGTKPVPGLSVIATGVFGSDGTSTSVQLRDDGEGNPDVALNDGLYTGVMIPAQDGLLQLSVSITPDDQTVRAGTVQKGESIVLNSRASILMLPVDQEDVGCGLANCETFIPPKGLTKTVTLEQDIEVKNRGAYKTEPIPAIGDLNATQGENNDDFILQFSAPSLVGEVGSPSRYDVYSSTDESALTKIDTGNTSTPLPQGVTLEQRLNSTVLSPTKPGRLIEVAQKVSRDATRHFVIVSRNGVNYSPVSNKASVGEVSEDSKPWLETTGGIITIVAIVVIVFAGAVGGGWYLKKRRASKAKSNQSV